MRGIVLLVLPLLLLFSGNLPALSTDGDNRQPSGQEVRQSGKPAAEKSRKPSGKPAATFKPTEKIGADSAVSFPVDI